MRMAIIRAMLKLGLWPFAPPRVYNVISAGGFRNVHRETYTTIGKPHLHEMARKWVARVMLALVPSSMITSGAAQNQNEASNMIEQLVPEFEKHCKEGAFPLVNLGVTIAQKYDLRGTWTSV